MRRKLAVWVMSEYVAAICCSFLFTLLVLHETHATACFKPKTIDATIQMFNCDQPYFFSFLPKTEENMLLDNVCVTFLTLPDDPNIVIEYDSFVYCDGSNYVQTFIMTPIGKGLNSVASPMMTYRDYIMDYVGCDVYTAYRCPVFGDESPPYVFGFSTKCNALGLSCLRKVQESIKNSGLPMQENYILPNKLPNRCVVQAPCTLPPNPFYNKLGPTIGLAYSDF